MKYINANYSGDARQQMMIRSLLQSEKFPEKIKTVQSFANSKAQEYLGTACGVGTPGINASDQNYFLKCLAAYGAPEANAQFHYLNAVDQAQTASSAGKAAMNNEISQSDGYAPPRNCSGSLALQQQTDTQYDTAYQEKDIAVAAALRLEKALAAGQTTQSEYDRARVARDQAIANANALGQRSDSPIVDICKAIDSPATFVSSSINSYLAKHFDESSQLKSENLPFYANFLADVASNFLTNILTGGKSTSQIFKEAGVGALNGALIGVSQAARENQVPGTIPNPTGDVTIYARSVNGTERVTTVTAGQPYVLVVRFQELVANSSNNNDPRFNPYRVSITGVVIEGGGNKTLSSEELAAGNIAFDFTAPASSFTVTAQLFAQGTQNNPGDVSLNTSGGWKQSFTVSQVNGASTILFRGPAVNTR